MVKSQKCAVTVRGTIIVFLRNLRNAQPQSENKMVCFYTISEMHSHSERHKMVLLRNLRNAQDTVRDTRVCFYTISKMHSHSERHKMVCFLHNLRYAQPQ